MAQPDFSRYFNLHLSCRSIHFISFFFFLKSSVLKYKDKMKSQSSEMEKDGVSVAVTPDSMQLSMKTGAEPRREMSFTCASSTFTRFWFCFEVVVFPQYCGTNPRRRIWKKKGCAKQNKCQKTMQKRSLPQISQTSGWISVPASAQELFTASSSRVQLLDSDEHGCFTHLGTTFKTGSDPSPEACRPETRPLHFAWTRRSFLIDGWITASLQPRALNFIQLHT